MKDEHKELRAKTVEMYIAVIRQRLAEIEAERVEATWNNCLR